MSGPIELRFVTSADRQERLPVTDLELAVVGRSNVGKSSLINAIAKRKKLAHVSNTPGRTRLLNLFAVGPDRGDGKIAAAMMDLPGYGYAQASKDLRESWRIMIEEYLLERESLTMVIVLVDGEVGPTKLDIQMLNWLRSNGMPHSVVATKHDKVKSSKLQRRKREVAEGCDLEPRDIIWVSSAKGTGIDRLRSLMLSWLEVRPMA